MNSQFIPLTPHERFGFQKNNLETPVAFDNSFPLVPVLLVVGGAAVAGFFYYKSLQVTITSKSTQLELDIKNIKKDIARHDINFGQASEKISAMSNPKRKTREKVRKGKKVIKSNPS